jgi:hypothetical protein
MALSSPKAPAKVFMVERVKHIVLKAARLIDSSIYDLEENNTWDQGAQYSSGALFMVQ